MQHALDYQDLLQQLEAAYARGDAEGRAAEVVLIKQAQAGDRAAFGALYRRYVTSIFRYCSLRVDGRKDEAEDLTSNVFLRAWQHIGGYQERGKPFLAWLHSIAHNLVVDEMRKGKQFVALEESLPGARDLSEDVDRRIEHEQLRHALHQLTDEQRQALMYQYVLGYTSEQTGAVMGKRAGAVRQLQLRALQTLRRILGQDQA